MKRKMTFVLTAMCCVALLGCGAEAQPPEHSASGGGRDVNDGGNEGIIQEQDRAADAAMTAGIDNVGTGYAGGQNEPEQDVWRLRIVDGAESGNLMLAGENAGEVYSIYVSEEIPIYLDGAPGDRAALEDGMMIEVAFDGIVMETFPAQIGHVYSLSAYSLGTQQNPGGGLYDLCGLYLQILNDLWDKDAGLNADISYIGVDLSQAPGGLTEGEKRAIAWIFAAQHNGEPLMMTYEELAQEGYFTETAAGGNTNLYQWDDGILFTITAAEWEEDEVYFAPVVKFNAKKWRSPLGAYYFVDCWAVWPEMGTWNSYKIGGEVIS